MGVLSCVGAVPGGKPFETSGKDSIMLRRRKHGTTGQLALPHQHRQKGEIAETVRSAPGRDPRMARFIRVLAALARLTGPETFGLDLFVCTSYKQAGGGKNGSQVCPDSSGNVHRRSQAR